MSKIYDVVINTRIRIGQESRASGFDNRRVFDIKLPFSIYADSYDEAKMKAREFIKDGRMEMTDIELVGEVNSWMVIRR